MNLFCAFDPLELENWVINTLRTNNIFSSKLVSLLVIIECLIECHVEFSLTNIQN